jgi:hypothetical protein
MLLAPLIYRPLDIPSADRSAEFIYGALAALGSLAENERRGDERPLTRSER